MYILRQINRYKLSSNLLTFYGLEDETTVKEGAMTGFVFSFQISCTNSLLKITSLELLLCIIIKETTYHFTDITTTTIVIPVVYYT